MSLSFTTSDVWLPAVALYGEVCNHCVQCSIQLESRGTVNLWQMIAISCRNPQQWCICIGKGFIEVWGNELITMPQAVSCVTPCFIYWGLNKVPYVLQIAFSKCIFRKENICILIQISLNGSALIRFWFIDCSISHAHNYDAVALGFGHLLN